eukprot:TRINITY_DN49387_c0_g1_i1.p1 TRINITY_DN49387_c0_g1~~TRINITY_DN49387_c0_g1_i1.p1  ORF type:complete len:460 (-),score=60.68 TRINITY_DN49387_c0_g1_i1:13-1392(-)
MARLRPWNVFKKTLYDGGKGVNARKLPLTAQISLARARLKNDEPEAAAVPFASNLGYFLPPAIGAWLLLLAARWRYSDEERLRNLEGRPAGPMLLDFLGWRVTAHLGPYQVPNFARARLHESPLRLLDEPLLLDQERAAALGRLEQLTSRKEAVITIRPEGEQQVGNAALRAIEPVLRDFLGDQRPKGVGVGGGKNTELIAATSSAAAHRAASTRIVFDVVGALAPEDRAVPPWVLANLVTARGSPWGDGPQGEELRAFLLVQLLGSPSNCKAAAELHEVTTYLQQLGMKSKADTFWPLKSYLLSGETPDLLRRGSLLVNRQCPRALEVPPKRERDTPSLQLKWDMRNLWTTTLVTVGWAAFRAWRGVFDAQAALAIARACGGAFGAMSVLEGLWRAEEHIIQSKWYFDDGGAMLATSGAMCLVNSAAFAWACRYPVVFPFLLCRGKDELTDAYRTFSF